MNIIEMQGITKRFGEITANHEVSFTVKAGEIHCLLGENGAGKSTLVRILFGLSAPDHGSISVKGERVTFRGPSEAIDAGIGMIHQHFMLVDRLTITENIIAGAEIRQGHFIDYGRAHQRIGQLAKDYGFRIHPEQTIEEISVGEQQRVEILKALYREAEILILDEPTAVLTPQETAELFNVMRELKAAGKTIIFITHKLRETLEISDRVTILRDGRHIDTVETASTSAQELANKMVGRQVLLRAERRDVSPGEVVLDVRGLTFIKKGKPVVQDIGFTVREGEILGVAGVEGNGQLELEELLMGLATANTGTIRLLGQELSNQSVRQRRSLGIAHIPSDRLRRGIIRDLSVAKNLILGSQWTYPFSTKGVFHQGKILEYADQMIKRYDIRGADPNTPAASLSGGNQQKLVIARELSRDPKLIVAAQPTRGVDVGAIEYIHQQLIHRKAAGSAILLISAELDEIRALSDRILVLYEGQVVAQGDAQEFTESELGLWMGGHKTEVGYDEGASVS